MIYEEIKRDKKRPVRSLPRQDDTMFKNGTYQRMITLFAANRI